MSDLDKKSQIFHFAFSFVFQIMFVQALITTKILLKLRDENSYIFFLNVYLKYPQLNHTHQRSQDLRINQDGKELRTFLVQVSAYSISYEIKTHI